MVAHLPRSQHFLADASQFISAEPRPQVGPKRRAVFGSRNS